MEMNYKEQNPEVLLNDFTKRFWVFNNPTNEKLNYTILPDGYCDLIITIVSGKLESIVLFGIWIKELEVVVPENSIIFGICFKPLASEYILKHNLSLILNSYTTLPNDFWGIDKLNYEHFDLFVKSTSVQMIAMLQKIKQLDYRKINIFKNIFEESNILSVDELSKIIFWNSRQINRYFNSRFGLSLKSYLNIIRCSSTYTDIRNGDFFPKGDFYDQSHFIKEVKKHTGKNPNELHKNENDRFLQFKTLQ